MTIETMTGARSASERTEYHRAARRYYAALALYVQTLDDIRSVDARLHDAFKAAGLELRDLQPPDAE